MAERPAPTGGIAVATVSYGSADALRAFLASVGASSVEPLTVVVADNKGESTIRDLAASYGAAYLPLPENPGYGTAINRAIATLPDSIEWVLISNPDVELDPGSLDALVAAGSIDPAIGSVGPRVLNEDGSTYPSARAIPSLRTGVGHALFSNIWLGNPWTRAYHGDSAEPDRARDAGWLSGSCVLVRLSAFRRIGGFDPTFFMYFEDVDLGFRFGRAGFRNRYEPASRVTHTGAHSTESDSEAMIRAHHASARRFLARKYAGLPLLPVRAVLNISLALRSLLLRRRVATRAR